MGWNVSNSMIIETWVGKCHEEYDDQNMGGGQVGKGYGGPRMALAANASFILQQLEQYPEGPQTLAHTSLAAAIAEEVAGFSSPHPTLFSLQCKIGST